MILLLGTVVMSTICYSKNILKKSITQNREHIKEVTLQISNNIGNEIKNCMSELNFISSKVKIDENNKISIEKNILSNEIKESVFKEILVIDIEGKVINTSGEEIFLNESKILKTISKEKNKSVSEPIKSELANGKVILYSIPIIENNEILGVICGVYNTKLIENQLSQGIYKNKGFSYIINKSGDILFSTNKNKEHSNLYNDFDKNSVDSIKNEYKENRYFSIKCNMQGKENYLEFTKIYDSNWYAVTAIASEDIFLEAQENINIIIIIITLAIFLCLSISLYISRIHKTNEKKILDMAFKDELTGLMNYKKFILTVEDTLLKYKNRHYVLVCFDIDKFKLTNDIYGYKIGDEIIRIISKNLQYYFEDIQCYFKDDVILGRLNGDVFGLLIEIKENEFNIAQLAEFIKKKIGNIESTKNFNLEINVDLSIGIYNIENEEINIKKIVDNAGMARLKAKENRYENYVVFDEKMSKQKKKIIQMEIDLFSAVKNKEFYLFYQPKFNINTDKIVGSEALIRWMHPDIGMVSPVEFIPLAEKTRLINNIGQWVFEEVCIRLRGWIDEGIEVVPIAINLSRVELYQQDLVDMLKFGIYKYKIDPKLIEIEITESTALNDTEFINEKIAEIKLLGMKVAMDDFGTGNSNLSSLKDMQIDVLKLDRSLLQDIENNDKTKLMVKSILDLSKNLSLYTVCEGVENISQVEILKNIGCEIIQGYVFSKPVEVEQYKKLLLRNN